MDRIQKDQLVSTWGSTSPILLNSSSNIVGNGRSLKEMTRMQESDWDIAIVNTELQSD
ncbi:hypothetical protein EYZ11_002671 [Aspergillus tanneri]|uniref:Uncharacterized protein n=1 Tax=Aspergillus tanneri TaxID=1220188 RepID=A0A4S3JU09_9EURO|nr:hypothetical protein EYZ11_002671 [Aspergillus tanneri]